MKGKDYIVGMPSGEILFCRNNDIYDLVLSGLIRYHEYLNGEKVDSYFFNDILTDDIKKIIYDNISYGDHVEHKVFGKGRVNGPNEKGTGVYVYFYDKGVTVEISLDTFLSQKNVKLI